MLAHEREREIAAVGDPEDVPLGDPQRRPQVGEVGGVLGRVVGAEVDPSLGQTPVAGPRRRHLCAPGRRGVIDQTYAAGDEPGTLRAEERRLGEAHPALVHENELSVAVEPGVDRCRCASDGAPSGAASEVHDGIGRRRRRHGGDDGDRQANGGPGRPAASLGHRQIAAACGAQGPDRIRGDDPPPELDPQLRACGRLERPRRRRLRRPPGRRGGGRACREHDRGAHPDHRRERGESHPEAASDGVDGRGGAVWDDVHCGSALPPWRPYTTSDQGVPGASVLSLTSQQKGVEAACQADETRRLPRRDEGPGDVRLRSSARVVTDRQALVG